VLAFLALALGGTAAWAENVQLTSKVLVERVVKDDKGEDKLVLEEPKVVTPGEKLVFALNYKNVGTEPAQDFVITNPIPNAVSYSGGEADGSVVSVDGGTTWGALASLTVAGTDGQRRAAQPSDVTHVRWAFPQPIPVGAEGKLTFRGTVK
jgi:uncharacterized repeat protein (TIGR01451 family)